MTPLPIAKLTKILIVEDDIRAARDMTQQLQLLGYKVLGTATSGVQATELAGLWRPDLVLMAMDLPGEVDGIAAAQAIRQQLGTAVVFLAACPGDARLQRANITEPFGYLLKPFSERELHIVLAIAVYKNQADAKLVSATRQLQALSRRVLEAQEQERRRVAIELHDELGQSLTAIKINLQLGERFKAQAPVDLYEENIRIVESALQHVRCLATALRPSMLDDLGLAPALKWVAEQSASRSGFAVQFHHERRLERLAPEIETTCFRIVQEALTNITRHAHARNVKINLRRAQNDMVLTVCDDGLGFDVEAMCERSVTGASLGVLGMQERATLVGGTLEITSLPGQGSTVTLRCPWRAQ